MELVLGTGKSGPLFKAEVFVYDLFKYVILQLSSVPNVLMMLFYRLYGVTNVCYHAFYLPLIYVTFLADFFQVINTIHWSQDIFLFISIPFSFIVMNFVNWLSGNNMMIH